MPDTFPGSALVDKYLELQGNDAFREEYQYLIESQEGTPLGRFFDILNEADDDERIKKLTDFFLDYHIPFPKDPDRLDYFANFKYQNLKSNRELQIVLDLYCYAYENYVLNIEENQEERSNLEAIRGQLKEMGYVVSDITSVSAEGKIDLSKENIGYCINKVHMEDESQIAPKYKELLQRSIADYMGIKSPTIENFLSMIGTIEEVAPIIGFKEVKRILLAIDFTKLAEGEKDAINKLNDDNAVKRILQDKIKEDKVINEAKLIFDAYRNSQAAKDISSEIYALSQSGETVRLTTACKNAYQKYKGDKPVYKKEILKLCDPKIRDTIRASLEENDKALELSQERASRRPSIIGYARQLFQYFQGQRSERELEIDKESVADLEIDKESVADLKEAKNELVAISNDVVKSVNEEYGLASTYFHEVIQKVKKEDKKTRCLKLILW